MYLLGVVIVDFLRQPRPSLPGVDCRAKCTQRGTLKEKTGGMSWESISAWNWRHSSSSVCFLAIYKQYIWLLRCEAHKTHALLKDGCSITHTINEKRFLSLTPENKRIYAIEQVRLGYLLIFSDLCSGTPVSSNPLTDII